MAFWVLVPISVDTLYLFSYKLTFPKFIHLFFVQKSSWDILIWTKQNIRICCFLKTTQIWYQTKSTNSYGLVGCKTTHTTHNSLTHIHSVVSLHWVPCYMPRIFTYSQTTSCGGLWGSFFTILWICLSVYIYMYIYIYICVYVYILHPRSHADFTTQPSCYTCYKSKEYIGKHIGYNFKTLEISTLSN